MGRRAERKLKTCSRQGCCVVSAAASGGGTPGMRLEGAGLLAGRRGRYSPIASAARCSLSKHTLQSREDGVALAALHGRLPLLDAPLQESTRASRASSGPVLMHHHKKAPVPAERA